MNALFADISTTVDTEFQWLPYMDYVYSSWNETIGMAIAEKGDIAAGLDAWQDAAGQLRRRSGLHRRMS